MKDKLIDKYIKRIDVECYNDGDTEVDHLRADNILCSLLYELGYDKVVEEYDKVSKWYA